MLYPSKYNWAIKISIKIQLSKDSSSNRIARQLGVNQSKYIIGSPSLVSPPEIKKVYHDVPQRT
jgi:hypothetical protein